jgi:steroid 5-alpha reductase family enzyme
VSILEDPHALVPYLSLHPSTLSSLSSPLASAFLHTLGCAYVCWFLSVTTGNYSWTDRVWSLTPILFTYIFAAKDLHKLYVGEKDVEYRLVAIFALVFLWGMRLTYNFYRKGGYSFYSQDYRWTFLQEKLPFVFYQFFNIVFIAFYQNLLLLLISLPAYYIYFYRCQTPLTWLDYTALMLTFVFILGETIADQQQWNFHEKKQKKMVKQQFLTTGLWRYSRHPNFFCEQMIWVSIYLCTLSISLVQERSYINWSIIGCTLLVLLFQGSTTFTEYITLQKYPDYKKYQLTTSRLLPMWPSAHKKQN